MQPRAPTLTLDAEIRRRVRVGLVFAAPVRVGPTAAPLRKEIGDVSAEFAARHAGHAPAAIEGLAAARQLYRTFGIDPTRARPSSEALARRILQGRSFPEVLNAVDLGNLCAVRFLLPIGLYDANEIVGPVVLRHGLPGEAYAGIRKNEVHLEGRPVLADERGPFGNPTSDSARTAVTLETRALWMVLFAPADMDSARMAEHARRAAEGMREHLGDPETAVEASCSVLP